jgi:hypothetical protein
MSCALFRPCANKFTVMSTVNDPSVTELLALVECLTEPLDALALIRELDATLESIVSRHESEPR